MTPVLNVILELKRFRLVVRDNSHRIQLQTRSGRFIGSEEWYLARELGEYEGFVQELGQALTKHDG